MDIKFIKATKIQESGVTTVQLAADQDFNCLHLENGQQTLKLGISSLIKKINRRKLILLARRVVTAAKQHRIKKLAVDFNQFMFPELKMDLSDVAEVLATNFELANYEFVDYKKKPENGWKFIQEVHVLHQDVPEVLKKAFEVGQIVGRATNDARNWINTPSSDFTPSVVAQKTQQLFAGTPVKVKALSKKEIMDLGMGGVIGVAKGSVEDPQFLILEYMNGGSDKPLVLVGKTVTFDTGGLCLKPGVSMMEMHMDMAGGASVIHAISVASQLNIKKNIVGLVPVVENILSATSFRVNDILKMMSGDTVDVLNTDAEGRLILADALTYAKRYNPKLVLDVATLTGAARVAIGLRASALFANDEKLEKEMRELGEVSGDYLWPLPLWEEYEDDIKGTFSDLLNVPWSYSSRNGGAVVAAVFLWQFAKDYPWVHLDIASRMTPIEGEHLAKGAIGEPTRLLVKVLQRM